MLALAWKESQPYGSSPIKVKTFPTEKKRADFIQSLTEQSVRFEITSMSTSDSHMLTDFQAGMRVRIINALHTNMIGMEGTVIRTIKCRHTVSLQLDNGGTYGSFPWNLSHI